MQKINNRGYPILSEKIVKPSFIDIPKYGKEIEKIKITWFNMLLILNFFMKKNEKKIIERYPSINCKIDRYFK